MASIYLDTTERMVWGLLDGHFEWIHYEEFSTKQAASAIHKIISDGLVKCSIESKDLQAVFILNGPGSYTGIRIAEGIGQIFEWQGFPVYSFHAHEIPRLCGHVQGVWVGNAFKGEIYKCAWNSDKIDQVLLKKSEIGDLGRDQLFAHFENLVDSTSIQFTSKLIKENSKEIFSLIEREKRRRESFYYRPEDIEFTVAKK